MLYDLNDGRQHAHHDAFDVCIAGAGMAGIALALALADAGHRVLLLEGGGLDYDEQSQDCYRGDVLGRGYFDLDSARLRYLGGTSNHWAGWCRPLDPIDFRAQPQIPHSGWPIEHGALQPYEGRVCDILGIEHDFADIELPAPSAALKRIRFRFSAPVRFGEKFRRRLHDDRAIACYLNANLVDIRIDETSGEVTELAVANYHDRSRRHAFRARYFVLALGGIENVRLMLASRSQMSRGIGNHHDLVGRYFAEHFHVVGGYYAAERPSWPFADDEVYLGPTEAHQTRHEIANAGVRLQPFDAHLNGASQKQIREMICYSDMVADLVRLMRDVDCNIKPTRGGYVRVASEQVPNQDSRITLTDRLDAFGLPRVALDWQVLEVDRKTIVDSVTETARYLASNGYGHIRLADWILRDREIPDCTQSTWLGGGWHHMGTTRMSSSPETGVVDANLRVFGHDNLFVAGSSVFTTGGHANPSFTVVQVALRLADHLDQLLSLRST